MDAVAIKKFIAEMVPQGYSLSKIQDMLKERNVNITFMELRLLASEIESGVWAETEAKAEAARKKDAPAPSGAVPEAEAEDAFPPEADDGAELLPAGADQTLTGKTTVEVSPIARPGAVASGSVKFGSGVTAEWMLDQYGRLGLDKPTGKPTEQDIKEFQIELQKALG